MAHCGFEGTAVNHTFSNPLKALQVSLFGPKTEGAFAPDLPVQYGDRAAATAVHIPVSAIQRRPTNVGTPTSDKGN
jgi:hypothetical protein